MFLNKQVIDLNEERLRKLRSRLSKNRRKVFDNVTKDYTSVEEYQRGKYVEMRFRQAGLGEYPSNPTKIFRAVGDQAVHVQSRFGGRTLSESYVLKFLEEYDRSQQRENNWNFRSLDEKREQEGLLIRSQDELKRRQENFRRMLALDSSDSPFKGFSDAVVEPWKAKRDRPFGKFTSYNDDGDDDGDEGGGGGGGDEDYFDGQDGREKRILDNKLSKLLRQLLRRQENPSSPLTQSSSSGVATNVWGGDVAGRMPPTSNDLNEKATNTMSYANPEEINDFVSNDFVDKESPENIVEENAFLQPAAIFDPITGRSYSGMTPFQASSFQAMFESDVANASVNANVDRLRAKNNAILAKQNIAFKKKVRELFDANQPKRLNQFSESYPRGDGDDFDGGAGGVTVGQTIAESNLPSGSDRNMMATEMEEYMSDMRRPRTVRKVNFVLPAEEEVLREASEGTAIANGEDVNERGEENYIGDANKSLDKYSSPPSPVLYNKGGDFKPSDMGNTFESAKGVGISLDPAVSSALVSRMKRFGYSQAQIDAVLKDVDIDYETLSGIDTTQLVDMIDESLSKQSVDVTPSESKVSSKLIPEIEAYERDQSNGHLANLLSTGFIAKKQLNSVTPLIDELNKQSPHPTAPPISSSFIQTDQSKTSSIDDEEDKTQTQSSQPPYMPPPPPPLAPVASRTEKSLEQQDYESTLEEKLNLFAGGTPIQSQNAVQINRFVNEIVKNAPEEKEKERRRQIEEETLKQDLRQLYNPNKLSIVEVEKFDHVLQTVDPEDRKARFSRIQNSTAEDLDERYFRNVEEGGDTDISRVVDNAISSIASNATENLSDHDKMVNEVFAQPMGEKSFTSDFGLEEYIRACGINSAEEFNQLLKERMENEASLTFDTSKLTFLPSEPRPSLRAPPISLLPRDGQDRLLGAQPAQSGSGFVGDDTSIPVDNHNVEQVVTMELDENLLNTSQQNIQNNTLASDRNVMEETMKDSNYAARLKQLCTTKDKARFVVNLMIQDALATNRISQTMLANEDVIRYITVLSRLIEIIYEKSSTYFSPENGVPGRLEIINIATVQDSELPYFTLVHNGRPVCALFNISRNIFNFKMDVVKKEQFLHGEDSANESGVPGHSLGEFKEFFYYVAAEHGFSDPDALLSFRSSQRFRQSTLIRYQSMDPQMRTRNFFLLLDDYLLRLHVSGTSDVSNASVVLDTQLQSDMYRRFNTIILTFLPEINARIERMLASTPLALILTESERRSRSHTTTMSFRRYAIREMERDYTNGMVNGMFADNSQAEQMQWRALFSGWGPGQQENRESMSALQPLQSFTDTDRPPRGADLISDLLLFRRTHFVASSGENVHGGEWSVNPSLLMNLLLYLFVEKDYVPPLNSSYKTELGNFFGVLLADPVMKTFSQHVVFLYRRGWRKRSLAEQAALACAQLYVSTLIMVIVQTHMQNDCSITNTPRYLVEYGSMSPIVKISDMIKSFVCSFDPIAVLSEETNKREGHEKVFQHHSRHFAESLNSLVDSFERWLHEEIPGGVFGIPELQMARNEMFLRVIGAGGFQEARENYLTGVAALAADNDEATQSFQLQNEVDQRDDNSGEKLTPVFILLSNVGSLPNSTPRDGLPQAITTVHNPAEESAKVFVDNSHPTINNMGRDDLMKLISQVVVKELGLVIEKVNSGSSEVVKNNQSGTDDSLSFIAQGRTATNGELRAAAASTVDYTTRNARPLDESVVSQTYNDTVDDLSPLDSASNIADVLHEASTVDFNAPSQLLMVNTGGYGTSKPEHLQRVESGPTKVVIEDPELVTTSHDATQAVVEDGPGDDDGIADIVSYVMRESDALSVEPRDENYYESQGMLEETATGTSDLASSIDFANLERLVDGGLELPRQSKILFNKDSGTTHAAAAGNEITTNDEVLLDPYRASAALLNRNEKHIKDRFKYHVKKVEKQQGAPGKVKNSSTARKNRFERNRSPFLNTTPAGREVSTRQFEKKKRERQHEVLVESGIDRVLTETKEVSKAKQKATEQKRQEPSNKSALVITKKKRITQENKNIRQSPYNKGVKVKSNDTKDSLLFELHGLKNSQTTTKPKIRSTKVRQGRKRQLLTDEKLFKQRIRKQVQVKRRKLKDPISQGAQRLVTKGLGERAVGIEDYFAATPRALNTPRYSGVGAEEQDLDSSVSASTDSSLYS